MDNKVMDVLMNRKSVRVFEKEAISKDIKNEILNAAMRAPTAGNSMLYSILDITDQSIKDKLAVTCDNQPFIATAPMVLIFLADYRRWYRKFEQAECDAEIPVPQEGDLLLAVQDTVIAAHAACVAAESFGVGSCYIGDILENWEIHKELLYLPEYVAPISMLVFGYPTQQQKDRPQPPRFPKEMIIFENVYRDLSDNELLEYKDNKSAKAFYERKYVSDFTKEMTRSSKEIIKNWSGK